MNFFAVIQKADGVVELVSPPLSGMILPGVTRDSILALCRQHADPANPLRIAGLPENLTVVEREIGVPEVREAARAGTLLEVSDATRSSPSPRELSHNADYFSRRFTGILLGYCCRRSGYWENRFPGRGHPLPGRRVRARTRRDRDAPRAGRAPDGRDREPVVRARQLEAGRIIDLLYCNRLPTPLVGLEVRRECMRCRA